MSFWLDEDDEEKNPFDHHEESQSSTVAARLSQQGPFLDDEEEEDPLNTTQKSIFSQDQGFFRCENCGSSEKYTDGESGKEICAHCFTESSQQPTKTEVEFEDVAQLAAKRKGGGFVQRKTRLSSRRLVSMKGSQEEENKYPFQDLDASRPLPNVMDCVNAMTKILKVSCRRILNLMGDIPLHDHHSFNFSVKTLWSNYLHSWKEAADFYARKYPEIRLSLRDSFLSRQDYSTLMDYLSLEARKAIKREKQMYKTGGEPPSKKHKIKVEDDATDTSEEEPDHPEGPLEVERLKHDHRDGHAANEEAAINRNKVRPEKFMVHVETKGRNWGPMDLALVLHPSMEFAAAILLLAFVDAGLTPNKILDWIANGSLPLLNAFVLFDPVEQETMHRIRYHFKMTKIPSVSAFESLVSRVAVACRIKSLDAFREGHGKGSKATGRISLVKPSRVPDITAQFVADLGFQQRTLDICLALMGLPSNPTTHSMPFSMDTTASPSELYSVPKILALIFCAHVLEEKREVVVRTVEGSWGRFVPRNASELRLLTTPESVRGYAEFLEEQLSDAPRVVPELSSPQFDIRPTDPFADRGEEEKTNPIIFSMSKPSHKSTKTVLWRRIIQRTRRFPPKLSRTAVPLDPTETALLEYIAYVTRTNRRDLDAALQELV